MLFNSAPFLFAFLPITLIGYYAILRHAGKLPSQLWLFAASLGFYAWWNPPYLLLILISMSFNYWVGCKLLKHRNKPLLVFGLTANLLVLGYYKYMIFFLTNLNDLAGMDILITKIILPLGISFFTFQKIAFLVDCYKRQVPKEQNWINFGLFVSFFPQLIAGPIVHHKEMMPQFDRPKPFSTYNLTAGLCLLLIGLFKKVIIADALDSFATPLFALADTRSLHMIEAWCAMLAYTFQIYFDFSGYCDMAMGLALMFGVRLPVNFFSPYKAKNIIEFWRRWHMTLSRFLRDYLYIPLGGSRKGRSRQLLNLFATMLLGGLWHGAQWTFVVWGAMHGTYLIINHMWQGIKNAPKIPAWAGRLVTFLAVAVAWVFFRAPSMESALSIVSSLTHTSDMADMSLYESLFTRKSPLRHGMSAASAHTSLIIIFLSFLICLFMPNSVEIMRRAKPVISGLKDHVLTKNRMSPYLTWDLRLRWGIVAGIVASLCVAKVLYEPSQVFLYFQF